MAITITPGTPVIPDEFVDLDDVPASYTGEAGKLVAVNATEDGLEFIAGSGGAVDSVNGQTGVVVLDADDIDDAATTHKFATAAELTKLAGIEDAADVTDAGNVGAAIHGVTGKTTPVDADTMPLIDSAASNVLKKVTWANIKATLKTYFDTLYGLLGSANTWTAINTFSANIIAGTIRRATETSALTLMGGTSITEGPYIKLTGKDVGGADDGTIIYLATSESSAVGEHIWYTYDGASALERMRLSATTLTVAGGGLIIGGAQALDLYDHDTFTPVVADAAAAGNTATGTFSGRYVVKGKEVTCWIQLTDINTSGMTGGNALFIRGLPYTAVNASGFFMPGDVLYSFVAVSGGLQITPLVVPNTTYLQLYETVTAANFAAITVSDLTSGFADIYIKVSYYRE